MGNKFNFKSAICTSREQSERLLKLGLKKETADMCWIEEWGYDDDKQETFCTGNYFIRPIDYVWDDKYINYIPAWSLHRLLSLYNLHYIEFMNDEEIESVYDIVIDAIEQAIKEGYFNKEYLEE